MQILINGHAIDFIIENEQTVKDIVASVDRWCKERSLILMEVRLGDEVYRAESVPETAVEEVSEIDCTVQSKADVVFTTIDEGIAYCNRAMDYIEDEEFEIKEAISEFGSLAEGLNWLVDVVRSVLALMGLDASRLRFKDSNAEDFLKEIDNLRSDILSFSQGDDKANELLGMSASYCTRLKELFQVILFTDEMKQLVVGSIESPDTLMEALDTIRDEIEEQQANIQEAAIAFQSGNDKDGLEKLNRFVDFVYLYSRTCYQISPVFSIDLNQIIIDEVSMADKNAELTSLLSDISEVMESGDIISLADILEYEILPAMDDLNRYVDMLYNSIESEK